MKNSWLIIVGSFLGPKTFYGPFDDEEYMHQWIGAHLSNQHYEIAPMWTNWVNPSKKEGETK